MPRADQLEQPARICTVEIERVVDPRVEHRDHDRLIFLRKPDMGYRRLVDNPIDRFPVVLRPLRQPFDLVALGAREIVHGFSHYEIPFGCAQVNYGGTESTEFTRESLRTPRLCGAIFIGCGAARGRNNYSASSQPRIDAT